MGTVSAIGERARGIRCQVRSAGLVTNSRRGHHVFLERTDRVALGQLMRPTLLGLGQARIGGSLGGRRFSIGLEGDAGSPPSCAA